MGDNIRAFSIAHCFEKVELAAVDRILEGKRFGHLKVKATQLFDNTVCVFFHTFSLFKKKFRTHFLNIMDERKVEKLSLAVKINQATNPSTI